MNIYSFLLQNFQGKFILKATKMKLKHLFVAMLRMKIQRQHYLQKPVET